MGKTVIINESQLRRIVRKHLFEDTSSADIVYGEYMKYIESIGQHGVLQPTPLTESDELWYNIGACTFYLGYTSEGEFDEEEFCEFLDYFFGKYGEGVLKPEVSPDDVYQTFLPEDLVDGLTPDGLTKYRFEVINRGKEAFNLFRTNLDFNEKGQIFCARAVQLGNGMTEQDFQSEYGEAIGIYWSFVEWGAKSYYSNVAGPEVVFKGWVNPDDVEWGETIQTQCADEQELRLKPGVTVQVDQILTDYSERNLLTNGSILLQT